MSSLRTTPRGALAAALAAVATVVVVIILTADRPSETLWIFLSGPLANRFALGNTLSRAGLLALTGTGVVIAFRAGVFNLGGEGQVYLGAVAVTWALNSGRVGPLIASLLAVACSALLAGTSGAIRHKTGADELITSFLLSAGISPVLDYLIVGPLRDQASNLLATPQIPEMARLTALLPPSSLTTGALWAVVISALAWILLHRSLFGYEMRITGYNRNLARYAGLPIGRYTVAPMALSGALHGLAGVVLVRGVHFRSISGFAGGLGWNGIAVALIARNRPELVLPAALFFAYLEAGSRAVVLQNQTTWELGSIVQAVVFLFVTADVLRRLKRTNRTADEVPS